MILIIPLKCLKIICLVEKAIELASSNTVIIQADVMLKYLIFNHLRNLAYEQYLCENFA